MVDPSNVELLAGVNNDDGAEPTFCRVLQRIADATESISIHMFVWRNDDIGNRIGQAVLDAAERGVDVHIRKDLGAAMYESIEMNGKPFFPANPSLLTRLSYRIAGLTFPDSSVDDERDWVLGRAVLDHPNVTIEWVNHTHTKYYLVDNRFLITGSINIEDRHRGYHDYMVEIVGTDNIARFHSRFANTTNPDPSRPLEFLFNHERGGHTSFEIKPCLLALLEQAQKSVYLEMAYLGDPDVSASIVSASRRGVIVHVLMSRVANVSNDINYRTISRICTAAPAVRVYLSETMVHSKLLVVDERIVLMGSANASIFSMEKAVEMDVLIQANPPFLAQLHDVISSRLDDANAVSDPSELAHYNPIVAALQHGHQKLS